MIIILLCVSLLSSISFGEKQYTGFSVSMNVEHLSKPFLEMYHFGTDKAFNKMLLGDVNEFLLGNFLSLILTNIAVENITFNGGNLKESHVTDNGINLEHQGDIANINFSLKYNIKLFNIVIISNLAIVQFKVNDIKIKSTLSQDEVIDIVPQYEFGIGEIHGFIFPKQIGNLILKLLKNRHGSLISKTFESNLTSGVKMGLTSWNQLKPFPNFVDKLNMTIYKKLTNHTKIDDKNMLLTFDTEISVVNRPYNKPLYKYYKTKNESKNIQEICFGKGLVPAVAEVRGKARDFLYIIDPSKTTLVGDLTEFHIIMPRLKERIYDEQKISIGCKIHGDNDIVPLKQKDMIKVPINCVFNATPSGIEILDVNIVTKWNYTLSIKEAMNGFTIDLGFKSLEHLTFNVASSVRPVQDTIMLHSILLSIAKLLKDVKFFPEPMNVNTIYKQGNMKLYIGDDVICVSFK